MKLECICIKSHLRTENYVKYKFEKNKKYKYCTDDEKIYSTKYVYIENKTINHFEYNNYYKLRVEFSKYFISIKDLRKQKLEQLKKVVQL